jgi:hypothetical protein
MFKALIRSVVLFSLLLINIALFSWCVNQLGLGQSQHSKNLISNVQAQTIPKVSLYVAKLPITQRPIITNRTQIALSTQRIKPIQRLILNFRSVDFHLDRREQVRLKRMFRKLSITPSHSVEIFYGSAVSESNIPIPRTSKLRAQSVARIIYPATQAVKMYYRPTMEEGQVIVEFFAPKTITN